MFDWLRKLFTRKPKTATNTHLITPQKVRKTVHYGPSPTHGFDDGTIPLDGSTTASQVMLELLQNGADVAVMEIGDDGSAVVTYEGDGPDLEAIAQQMAEQLANNPVVEATESAAEAVVESTKDAAGAVEHAANEAFQEVEKAVGNAAEAVEHVAEETFHAVEHAVEHVTDYGSHDSGYSHDSGSSSYDSGSSSSYDSGSSSSYDSGSSSSDSGSSSGGSDW